MRERRLVGLICCEVQRQREKRSVGWQGCEVTVVSLVNGVKCKSAELCCKCTVFFSADRASCTIAAWIAACLSTGWTVSKVSQMALKWDWCSTHM